MYLLLSVNFPVWTSSHGWMQETSGKHSTCWTSSLAPTHASRLTLASGLSKSCRSACLQERMRESWGHLSWNYSLNFSVIRAGEIIQHLECLPCMWLILMWFLASFGLLSTARSAPRVQSKEWVLSTARYASLKRKQNFLLWISSHLSLLCSFEFNLWFHYLLFQEAS